ncbi:unnamed protein product [Cuscuta epithymum]|uniref:BZIP domain-containing protein n=1 Tax=Cuscuta epithymum TaxID=186058 RepID=A0AAV0ENL8_9ASTE|nr:unnamed protein product [Cuscuta epithymum]
MGSSEDGKSPKPEKSSLSPQDHGNAPMYLDWAALQAYYGPQVALPPYFNPAVPPGHPPHPYMWGAPQPMMSPAYGAPYATIYAHGGVYAHTGVPIGSHAPGHDIPTPGAVNEATAATSTDLDKSGKSSGNEDRGLISKLKGFDGLAMSIGNSNADSGRGGTGHPNSQSMETDGSSDGSNAAMVCENSKKGSRETTPTKADKTIKSYPSLARGLNGPSKKVTTVAVTPSVNINKVSPTNVPQLGPAMPNETWTQNERDLKREKRKQSNRESARRSRLRKQAETEELAKRVQLLTAENVNLKSEINKLMENSEKLKLENMSLMERLKCEELGKMEEEISLGRVGDKGVQPVTTANLLARVDDNSDCADKNGEEGETYERSGSNSRTKLHQLLDASPITDAVAAR